MGQKLVLYFENFDFFFCCCCCLSKIETCIDYIFFSNILIGKPERKVLKRGRKSTITLATTISNNKRSSLGRTTRGKAKEETESENENEDEDEDDEDENVSSESDDEVFAKTKNKPKKRTYKKTPQSRSKSHRKPQITEDDDEEEEGSEEVVETRGRKRPTLSPQAAPGRPKREASMRASAMIIQTNEIEKTRFQYYSSANTTTPSLISPTHHVKPEKPTLPKNTKKQPGTSSSTTNDVNFQVPQTPVKSSPITKSLKKTKTSSTSPNLINSNLRHIPTVTTMANSIPQVGGARANGDGSSSNDILIVAETTGTKSKTNAQKTLNSSNERPLTEDILAEHNKICGTQTCGGGTFSNYTREYISKWAMEYEQPEEKPFPAETIPIETYGVKVLNEPQYLNHNKSKSSLGSNTTTPKTTKQTSTKTELVATKTTEPAPAQVPQVTTKKQQALSNQTKDVNTTPVNTTTTTTTNPADNQPKSTSTNATTNTNSNNNNNNNNNKTNNINSHVLNGKSLEDEASMAKKTLNEESITKGHLKVNKEKKLNQDLPHSNPNSPSDQNNDDNNIYCNNNNSDNNNNNNSNNSNSNKIHFLATKLVST